MKVQVIEVKTVKPFELLRQNRQLETKLEQAEIIICRNQTTIDDLHKELVEANDKLHQLERAVKAQSACWMCSSNKICHQGAALPQSPDACCGKFTFGYKQSQKHSKTCCDYKHGKYCWGQKDTPQCDEEFCPLNRK